MILSAALLLLGGFIAYTQFSGYHQIESQERERLSMQAEMVEKNVVSQLVLANRVIERILDDLPAWRAEKDGYRLSSSRIRAVSETLLGIGPILVIQADGEVIASSDERLVGMNFAYRDYFITAVKNPDPNILHVSAPFKTVLDTYVISLFRSIRGPRGEFAGIVIASVVPEYFSVLLDSVRYAPDVRVGIIHGDGKLFLMAPAEAAMTGGVDLAGSGTLLTRHLESGKAANVFTGTGYLGGANVMTAIRTVQVTLRKRSAAPMDKPLVVALARDLEAIFAPWRKGARTQGVLFGLITVLGVFGLLIVQKRLRYQFTERQRAVEAQRESEARLKEAQRIANIGNWELDLVTNTLNWSDEIFRIFEFDRYHFVPSFVAFLALIHPDDRGRVDNVYAQCLHSGQPYEISYRLLMPDGRIKQVQEKCEVFYSPEMKPLRSLGTVQDISERTRLEQQLVQAQKMEAIGQLAGGVAHDFNNILAATMMNLELLQQNPHLDAETREALKDLRADSTRAANLTRQLLMFSRRSVMEIRTVDLNEVVENLLKMLGRLLGEHITLVFERSDALPLVEADAGMLEQVLMNLAVNARDAMAHGGRITLSTEPVINDAERASGNPTRRAGTFARLSVSDTGCGMDDATLARIFEPFFTTKAPGKGTGLGLAMVYGIVTQHRGWVEVESRVGSGTTFRIHLPASPKRAVEEQEVRPPAVAGGRETILAVEDDASVRRLLEQSLRRLGYRVLTAANGQEAMNAWRDHGPQIDLLLTDMVMPYGMTGLELAQRIRTERPAMKIIISSGYNTELTEIGAPTAEGIVHLSKPYAMSVLGATVRRCLDGVRHEGGVA